MSTYLPEHFRIQDFAAIKRLIVDYPFATMLCQSGTTQIVSHLPLILDPAATDEKMVLLGHMAFANPQWRVLNNTAVTVIINGPHSYVTPQWYVSGRDVPTWNYAVAHIYGQAKIVEDPDRLLRILKLATAKFESGSAKQWEFSLPTDLPDPKSLMGAIVGFEIHVDKIDAKFKLSQNRPEADRQGIIAGFENRGDEMSLAVRAMMQSAESARSKP